MVSSSQLSSMGMPLEFKSSKNETPFATSSAAEATVAHQTAGIFRQNTMEFIGNLLRGVETPDEPLPQLFDGLVADFPLGVDENGLPQRMPTPALAAHCEGTRVPTPGLATAHQTEAAAGTSVKRPPTPLAQSPTTKRLRREPSNSKAHGDSSQPSTSRAPAAAPAAAGPAKKAKNPKRADRRRTIARFTTAILRAGGSNAFIARDGLGYRKAFDRFLVETYGSTFAEGGYWYENARVEPFFRILFHVATEGRVNLDENAVNSLFCKREKRQAAEWLLDEQALSQWGVTAQELAAIFEGPPTTSAKGFVRGTPLAIPTDLEVNMQQQAPPPMRPPPVHSAPPPPNAVASSILAPITMTAPLPPPPVLHSAVAAPYPPPQYVNPQQQQAVLYHQMHQTAAHPQPPQPQQLQRHPPQPQPQQVGQQPWPISLSQEIRSIFEAHQSGNPQLAAQASIGLNRIMSTSLSKANSINTEEFLQSFQRYVGEQPEGPPKRQYSSDLARLMSEFNQNPSSSDEFLKSFLMRTASELDALSQKAEPIVRVKREAGGAAPVVATQ